MVETEGSFTELPGHYFHLAFVFIFNSHVVNMYNYCNVFMISLTGSELDNQYVLQIRVITVCCSLMH